MKGRCYIMQTLSLKLGNHEITINRCGPGDYDYFEENPMEIFHRRWEGEDLIIYIRDLIYPISSPAKNRFPLRNPYEWKHLEESLILDDIEELFVNNSDSREIISQYCGPISSKIYDWIYTFYEKEHLEDYPTRDDIITFLADYRKTVTGYSVRSERSDQYNRKYSWHFARMLQTTLGNGEIFLAFPDVHFVYVKRSYGFGRDVRVTYAYDINGIYCRVDKDCEKILVPEKEVTASILSYFLGRPRLQPNPPTKEELTLMLREYCRMKDLHYSEDFESKIELV